MVEREIRAGRPASSSVIRWRACDCPFETPRAVEHHFITTDCT